MQTAALDESARHYAVVARAIAFIRANATRQPSLEEVADSVHMSPFHLQRLFTGWAGISPKRFLQYLTKEHARMELARAADLLSVAADSGLSGPGRLHDLMISCEAMTPGEIRSGGLGLRIGCGITASPFGDALVAWTARGICHLAFCTGEPVGMIPGLQRLWPGASITRDDDEARVLMATVFPATPTRGRLHLLLRGTNFQIKVWEALIRTEPGTLVSYKALANGIAAPTASRAVGGAVAANTIGYLIPCHRVIRESGEVGNYRWGATRKYAMLGWEAARASGAGSVGTV